MENKEEKKQEIGQQIPKSVYKLKYRVENALKIFIVDGKKVRENYHMDFLAGSHHYKYDFIPEDEIWIDDAMNIDEIEPTIINIVTERTLMKEQKMTYEQAHTIAIQKELEVRKARNEIRDQINYLLYTTNPSQTVGKLMTITTSIKKTSHFDFLKGRIESEAKVYVRNNVDDLMKIDVFIAVEPYAHLGGGHVHVEP